MHMYRHCVPSIVAIFFSTIGSVFAIFGDTIRGSSSELSIGWNDAIGLGLAFLSFVCIALNVVTIRRIGDHPSIVTPDMVTVFCVNFGCVVGSLPTFFVDVDDWYAMFVSVYSVLCHSSYPFCRVDALVFFSSIEYIHELRVSCPHLPVYNSDRCTFNRFSISFNISHISTCKCFPLHLSRRLTVWEHIAIADYAMLAMICVVYQVGTVWLDKLSIPHIGSPLYAAMLPFRMVSTRDKVCLKRSTRRNSDEERERWRER